MKKTILAVIVGGLILFVCQFLSWGILNLHEAQQQYTPKQDSVMAYLNSQFSEDGAYMMPAFAPGTSRDEMEKQMPALEGKPWVQLVYHKAMPGMNKMYMNMGRGLLVNFVIIWLLCWILGKMTNPSFGTVFTSCLGTGMIIFLFSPYTMHIWYESFDLTAHLADAVVTWTLTGLWLGWWLTRKRETA